jgi:hypothetical protein
VASNLQPPTSWKPPRVVCMHQVSKEVTHVNNSQQNQGRWWYPLHGKRPPLYSCCACTTSFSSSLSSLM